MEYATEVIDRRTGNLVTQSLGEWKTVSELATEYDTGKNEFRHILIAMGLLSAEGRTGRRRLTKDAVRYGYGKRIDPARKSRVKFPFDVISPKGQAYISVHWSQALGEVLAQRRSSSLVTAGADALTAFSAKRATPMTAQMRVCWLLDHFPDITHIEVAAITSSSRQLVDHYAKLRSNQRSFGTRRLAGLSECGGAPPVPETMRSRGRNDPHALMIERYYTGMPTPEK